MDDSLGPRRGHIRSPAFRRVSHGLFLPILDGTAESEWRRDLGAWLAVLPDGASFTGLTAAHLMGWLVPTLPAWTPVFVAVPADAPHPQRAGLLVSRFARDAEHRTAVHDGLPVDDPAEVLLRCSRDLGSLDLVPLVDSALRSKLVAAEAIKKVCDVPRPGVRNLRQALARADARSESRWESVLRMFAHCFEIPVEVQPILKDKEGRDLRRGDLRVRGTNLLIEYDGADHRSRKGHRYDLRRERALLELGERRLGYTDDELLRQCATTIAELDRILGRRSRPSRLARWRRLVALSSHSRPGVDRLRTRWAVPMGAFIAG